MTGSLRQKVMVGVPLAFIIVMSAVAGVVVLALNRQSEHAARMLLQSTFGSIRHIVEEHRSDLVQNSRLMATLEDMGDKVSYVDESSAYFDYSVLRPTYMKIVILLYGAGAAGDIWKARLYDSRSKLIAFVDYEDDQAVLGCVHDQKTVETARVKHGRDASQESWTMHDALPASVTLGSLPHLPDTTEVRFEIVDSSLCQVAYVPVMGEEYDPAVEAMKPCVVGKLATVHRVGPGFVRMLSDISGVGLNIFIADTTAASRLYLGTLPHHDDFDFSVFPQVGTAWPLGAQAVSLGNVRIRKAGFYQAAIPVYSRSRCIAAIVSLYSKRNARRAAAGIVTVLTVIYLLGTAAIVPVTIAFVVRGIVTPIRTIAATMTEVAKNRDFSRVLPVVSDDEIGELTASFNAMNRNLLLTTTSVENLNAEVRERRMAEQKLTRTMEELERSNRELEQFAYVASHDLREPLRMVASYVKLLEKKYGGKLDQTAREFIWYAVDGADRMARLIDDLLTFSRVGTHGKQPVPTDAEAVFQVVQRNLQVAVQEKSARLTHDPLPAVMADENQLVQLLQNLCANALKFCKDRTPQVHVGVKRVDGMYVFSVRDNGIGIAPQHQQRIFQIFQQLHSHDEYEGTGIGLAVCKRIVERHGGKLWVESQVGEGATFYFTLAGAEGNDG